VQIRLVGILGKQFLKLRLRFGGLALGQLFSRLQGEMEESGIHAYPPGPWHAGLAPFPDGSG